MTIEALVDEQGHVADARVSQIDSAAGPIGPRGCKAVGFKPALLNGEPVPVLVMLELNFTLRIGGPPKGGHYVGRSA